MTTADEDARRIAQDFLDRQGEATVAGDVEATLDFCDLPCTLESMEGRAVATNRDEMRALCQSFIDGLRAKRLTHMVRTCLEATFKGADTIWATYETRYVRDGQLLTETPYAGFVVLRLRDGKWKISAMQFAAEGASPANVTLRDWSRARGEE